MQVQPWPGHASEHLIECLGFVKVTPDGRGDALVAGKFVMPDTQTMTFKAFVEASGEFLL